MVWEYHGIWYHGICRSGGNGRHISGWHTPYPDICGTYMYTHSTHISISISIYIYIHAYIVRYQTNIYGWWFQYCWYRWYSTTGLGWCSSMTPMAIDLFKPWSLWCGDTCFSALRLAVDLGIWMDLGVPFFCWTFMTLGLTNWPTPSISRTR